MDLRSWKFAIFSLCIFFVSGLVKNIVVSADGGTWCVAKPGASSIDLQHALDYACGEGGADCVPINPGGSCFTPDTLQDHASYAFNSYYQIHPIPTSCVFRGASTFTYTDPSNGNCHYPSSSSSTSPPGEPSPTTPSEPSQPTPAIPSQPSQPTPATPSQPSPTIPSQPTPATPSQPSQPTPATPFQPSPATPSQPTPATPTPPFPPSFGIPSEPSQPTPATPSQPSPATPTPPFPPSFGIPSEPSQPAPETPFEPSPATPFPPSPATPSQMRNNKRRPFMF